MRRLDQAVERGAELAEVFAGEEAGAHLVGVHAGLRAQHAVEQGFLRHFQREDGDAFAALDGGVFGDVDGEGGFAHGGTGGDDDEVGLLQAAGHVVEIGVVSFQAGDASAALEELVEIAAEGLHGDGADVGELLPAALLGEVEDAGFGGVDDLGGGAGLLQGLGDDGVGGVDEAAQHRFVAHDADVVLQRGAARHAVGERGQVAGAADGVEFLVAQQLLGEGDDVDGAVGLGEIGDALVDAAMGVEEKVLGLEGREGFVLQGVIEQNGAEDGALGFRTGGKTAIETEIGSRHRYGAWLNSIW